MRKLRTIIGALAALALVLTMSLFSAPAAAQPSGPGLILPAPTAEYVLSDNPTAEPLLQTEFTLGVTALVTTTQTVEMTIEAPSDFLVLSAGGGYSKETTFTLSFDNTSLGSLIQIDPNGQSLSITFNSSDDAPGYTIQLQSVAAPTPPDPNATAVATGSGAQSGGSSLPATAGNSADDSAAWLQTSSDNSQPFPFRFDGRHMLVLGLFALGAIALIAHRRRRASR